MPRTTHWHRFVIVAVLAAFGAMTPSASADDVTPETAQRAKLRAALAAQRELNLSRFHRYRVKRVYPHNTYQPGMLNVWTDADGHLCAVATLMKEAGQSDLVDATAQAQNFVRVADLTSGPLLDWVLTSGLTQEEIVMIQQPTEADVAAYEAEYRRQQRRLARQLAHEDARLAKNYAATERALSSPLMANAGLDVAVTRLEQHPALAAALLAPTR